MPGGAFISRPPNTALVTVHSPLSFFSSALPPSGGSGSGSAPGAATAASPTRDRSVIVTFSMGRPPRVFCPGAASVEPLVRRVERRHDEVEDLHPPHRPVTHPRRDHHRHA